MNWTKNDYTNYNNNTTQNIMIRFNIANKKGVELSNKLGYTEQQIISFIEE